MYFQVYCVDKRPFSHISAPTTIRLSLNFDIHNPFCILSDFLKQKAPRALMTVVVPNMEVLMLLALNWISQSLHTSCRDNILTWWISGKYSCGFFLTKAKVSSNIWQCKYALVSLTFFQLISGSRAALSVCLPQNPQSLSPQKTI